jgi:D-alanine--poly(phosphoribitol) ligase subunit 1
MDKSYTIHGKYIIHDHLIRFEMLGGRYYFLMRNSIAVDWVSGNSLNSTGILSVGKKNFSSEYIHNSSTGAATGILKHFSLKNSLVAVFLPKSEKVVISDLAIWLSGNFYTNLDFSQPEIRISALLNNLAPSLIITDEASKAKLEKIGVNCPIVCLEDLIEQPDLLALSVALSRVIDNDPSMVINTSGSTGVPKSVTLTHRNTLDFLDWVTGEFELTNLKIGNLSPFHFDIYTLELCLYLFHGCDLFLIPEGIATFPEELIDLCKSEKIEFLFWVPTIMVNIANAGIDLRELSKSLVRVFFAGEVFPTKQFNYWKSSLPATEFVNLYGPIEISIDCTFHRVPEVIPETQRIPIGKECRNTRVKIVNDLGFEAAIDQMGELWVTGSSVAVGYYNQKDLTSSRFIENPFNAKYKEIYYKTGDLVSRDSEGVISFHGRMDSQIKHLGYRIELSEIENVGNLHEKIRNSVAKYSNESKTIVFIYESDNPISIEDLRLHFMKYLPKYMVPGKTIHLSDMPMNANGKIDRTKLDNLVE